MPASPSTDQLHHEPEQQRYRVQFHDGGVGELTYRRRGRTLELLHTEVPAARRGAGLGARLMAQVLAAVETGGYRVLPVCPYTRHYLARHPRWAGLIADA